MNNFPHELDEVSTHTSLEQISDVDIDEILIEGKKIFLKGDGIISVELQFGSAGDQSSGDGVINGDSFPFDFHAVLEHNDEEGFVITEVENLEVDTSSYYE